MEADFSGWATKSNLRCTDGRTILPDAFKHMDGSQVPLVWQHGHKAAGNVLGYAKLTAMPEGVRADGFFNGTKAGQDAKELVKHGDIDSLSIYANKLAEYNKNVSHGQIVEVSLVLAGANPGAKIDFVNIRHSADDIEELDDEAIITTGELLHSADGDTGSSDAGGPSIQDVYDSMTEEQKNVCAFLVGKAVEDAKDPDGDGDDDAQKGVEDDKKSDAAHSDNDDNTKTSKEGTGGMTRNVFDQSDTTSGKTLKHADELFSADDKKAIFAAAMKGGSLKQAFEDHCLAHGITPMDVLFPEYKSLDNVPQFNKRRMEWVAPFLGSLSHSPFSRVKSIVADITMDEARAKGYIKGNLKREEWFSVSKRFTTPCTIYKKQQLDRDDIIDITDFDVVSWMKMEMDMMLKEEIARAILIGDGRDIADQDKIKDPGSAVSGDGLRSIVNEHELYKTDVNVNLGSTPNWELVVEGVIQSMEFYKGTGTPTFYTTWKTLTNMLLIKDTLGRRLYSSKADLASVMGVSDIIPVEVMESVSAPANLLGVIVNPADYNVGADKGGEVNLFDFFDIDYNQYKYLSETRISGALTKVKSAMVVWTVPNNDVAVTPNAPTFNYTTGVATVVATTGVVYKDGNGNTLTAGAQTAIATNASITIVATPASGYYFPLSGNMTAYWTFTRPAPDGANSNA